VVVLVANQRGASVSVLDATNKAVIATLTTGDGPHEVAVSPDGKTAVVTNYGGQSGPGNSLTVVDVATHTVKATISLGDYRRPHGAVFLPGGRQLIVTSETNQAVVIVDVDSAKVVHAIPTTQQGSHLIAVRADGKMGYTGNVRSGSITEIDIAGRATGRVLPVATNTEGIGVTPDGSEVWVASRDQHKLFVVNTKQWKVTDTLDAPGTPYRVAFSPDGKTAFVPSPTANVIRTFDTKTKKAHPPTQMPDGCQPVGIAVGHDGTTAYAACGQSATLQFIDVRANAIAGNLPTGPAPDGVAIARMN
jgi:YVTN family beta-propeller protein